MNVCRTEHTTGMRAHAICIVPMWPGPGGIGEWMGGRPGLGWRKMESICFTHLCKVINAVLQAQTRWENIMTMVLMGPRSQVLAVLCHH